jgi:hypothetical protein
MGCVGIPHAIFIINRELQLLKIPILFRSPLRFAAACASTCASQSGKRGLNTEKRNKNFLPISPLSDELYLII